VLLHEVSMGLSPRGSDGIFIALHADVHEDALLAGYLEANCAVRPV